MQSSNSVSLLYIPVVGIKAEPTVEAINTCEGVIVVMCLEADIEALEWVTSTEAGPDLSILDTRADMTEVCVIEVGLDTVTVLLMSNALKLVIGSVR